MKKTLIVIIIIGLVLLILGKIIMRYNNDDSDLALANNEDLNSNAEKEIINKEYDDVKNINLELGFYSIVIQEDSNIKNVQLTLKKPIINSSGKDINKIECKNGNLTISQRQEKSWFLNGSFNIEKEKGELLIKIPAKNKLNNISITNGVGSIKLNNISADSLKVYSGTSSVTIQGIDVTDCNIAGGTGSIDLHDISADKIEIESGTGSVFVNGDIRKKIDANTGTGSVQLELEGKEKDYNYDIETGLGRIEINQNTYKKKADIDNKSSYCNIEVNTGTGNVKIKTK